MLWIKDISIFIVYIPLFINAGLDLVKTDPVTGEGEESPRAIRELKKQEWDFIFINIINWIDTRGVFRVLHEFRNEPVILYSFGGFTDHEGKFGEKGTLISPAAGAGSTSLRMPMEQWGIKFKYLFNAPDYPIDIEGILSFAKAAYTMKRIRHARLGMIGYNDMGLYSTGINPTRLRDQNSILFINGLIEHFMNNILSWFLT